MRLFLAVDLPAEIRQALGLLQRELRGACAGWRWVAPTGIHLTLRFLGEVSPERDRELRPAWRTAARSFPPLRLELGSTGVFPGPRRPRVLWVGVNDRTGANALASLAQALEATARAGGFAPEERPFRPHLTLARADRAGVAPIVPPERRESGAAFDATVVTLFRSELLPTGARYTALDALLLEGGSAR